MLCSTRVTSHLETSLLISELCSAGACRDCLISIALQGMRNLWGIADQLALRGAPSRNHFPLKTVCLDYHSCHHLSWRLYKSTRFEMSSSSWISTSAFQIPGCQLLCMHMLQVVNSSWEVALREQEGLLSGILTNPPYIASQVIKGLQVSVNQQTTRSSVLICAWKAVRLAAPMFCRAIAMERWVSRSIPQGHDKTDIASLIAASCSVTSWQTSPKATLCVLCPCLGHRLALHCCTCLNG